MYSLLVTRLQKEAIERCRKRVVTGEKISIKDNPTLPRLKSKYI
jgi:hypothetical protein